MPPKKRARVNAKASNSPPSSRTYTSPKDQEITLSLGDGRVDAVFNQEKASYQYTITYESSEPFALTSRSFYGNPTFEFCADDLYHFLSRLPLHTKYIRKVAIAQRADRQPALGSLKKGLRLLTGVKHLEHLQIDTWNFRASSTEWWALLLKEFLSTMQDKINDRGALCQKIRFLKDFRGTPDDEIEVGDFLEAASLYLKDRPEVPVRRDTGRPKRAAITKKAISYAEDG
ncbi:hypothetical protein MBLNU457_g0864t2 [Dothideomycetes sp. NU457]